jgi:hypothetical protein
LKRAEEAQREATARAFEEKCAEMQRQLRAELEADAPWNQEVLDAVKRGELSPRSLRARAARLLDRGARQLGVRMPREGERTSGSHSAPTSPMASLTRDDIEWFKKVMAEVDEEVCRFLPASGDAPVVTTRRRRPPSSPRAQLT